MSGLFNRGTAFGLKVVIGFMAVAACSRDPQEMIARGKEHLARRSFREATIEFRSAISANPRLVEAHYELALAYAGLGQLDNTRTALQNVLDIDPNHLPAQIRLGNILLIERQFDAARERAMSILNHNADNVQARILLANSYAGIIHLNDSIGELRWAFESQPRILPGYLTLAASAENFEADPEAAETHYRQAVAENEAYIPARLALANFQLHAGQTARARDEFNRALSIEPQSEDALRALAAFHFQTGAIDEAERIYIQLAEMGAEKDRKSMILAEFYALTGRTPQAAALLQKVPASSNHSVLARNRLALLFLSGRDYAKAMAVVDEAIAQNPADVDLQLTKHRVQIAQNRGAESIPDLETFVRSSPLPVARFLLGLAYLQAQNNKGAEEQFLAATRTDATFAEAYVPLAELRLKAGNTSEAVRYARQALEFDPNTAEAHLTLVRAHITTREFGRARAELEAFLRKRPEAPEGLYHRGLVQYAEGNLEGAEASFSSALERNGEHKESRLALSQVYMKRGRVDRAVQALTPFPELLFELYARNGDHRNAEAVLQQFVGSNPANRDARVQLARFLARTGQAQKSVTAYEELLKVEPGNAAIALELAELHLGNKSHTDALRVIERVLAANSQNVLARTLKGSALLDQGKHEEALAELLATTAMAPESVSTRFLLGLAYQKNQRPLDAEGAWRETLRIEPRFVAAHVALGRSELAGGNTENAVRHAQNALELDPQLSEARILLGEAYMRRRDFSKASETFEALLRQEPANVGALQRSGTAYAALGDLAKAEAQFVAALRNNPNQTDALTALANIYIHQRRPQLAIRRIQDQLAQSPGQPRLYELLGQIHMTQKEYGKAEEAYRKALSLDGKSLSAYALLGQLFLVQNSLEKAVAEFENALKITPQSVATHTMLGAIHELRKDTAKAQIHYRAALSADARTPVAANNLAWLLAEGGGNLDEALKLAQIANEELPNMPNILDTLGWIHFKKGSYESAVYFFKESINREPGNPGYHYRLGLTYFEAANPTRARASLNEALRLNPNFQHAAKAREILSKLPAG